jgi:hypothetical protein
MTPDIAALNRFKAAIEDLPDNPLEEEEIDDLALLYDHETLDRLAAVVQEARQQHGLRAKPLVATCQQVVEGWWFPGDEDDWTRFCYADLFEQSDSRRLRR